jgi:uncharacterized protein YkwD
MLYRQLALAVVAMVAGPVVSAPAAHADNKRLNDGVVADVYTIQHHAGCSNDVTINLQLQSAAQRQALDGLNDRTLDGDIGSDGSTVQDRATAAGYRGRVSETVAINPAVAVSGIELINQWYDNPADLAVMSDCANTQIGVWSENSLDRTVVVAVYGAPEHAPATAPNGSQAGPRRRWLSRRTRRSTPAPTTTPATRSSTASTGWRGSCAACTRLRHTRRNSARTSCLARKFARRATRAKRLHQLRF